MKKSLLNKNNKGGIYAVIVAVVIMFMSGLIYIILGSIMNGSAGSPGLEATALNQSWINASTPTYLAVHYGWQFFPIALAISAFIYLIIQSQRPEPNQYYYGTG